MTAPTPDHGEKREHVQPADNEPVNPDAEPEPAVTNCIDRDVACIDCRYNLRGLMDTGNCPQCGRAIRDSLWSDRFEFARHGWQNWRAGVCGRRVRFCFP